jgi:serralysin
MRAEPKLPEVFDLQDDLLILTALFGEELPPVSLGPVNREALVAAVTAQAPSADQAPVGDGASGGEPFDFALDATGDIPWPAGHDETGQAHAPASYAALVGSNAAYDRPVSNEQQAAYFAYPYDKRPKDSDQHVDGLISGRAWNTTSLTYSFPDSVEDYEADYYDSAAIQTLSQFNLQQIASAEYTFTQYALVSGLTFSENTSDGTEIGSVYDADLRLANSENPSTAYAYYPSSNPVGGDAFFGSGGYDNPVMGNYEWATILHEIGHALGLKHPHERDGGGQVPLEWDSIEFSVMSYRSFVGKSLNYGYANEEYGFSQSLMMLDIAAIQRMYGANFNTGAGDTTYTFSTTTGEMFIDGVGVGEPGDNRVFRTIWDGDGDDTYDFSTYTTNLAIDLTPGGYSDLDVGGTFQRAKLEDADAYPQSVVDQYGLTNQWARGHVFNALLFDGDTRSLIENAVGGSGDDSFVGNTADNAFWGGDGDDTFFDSMGSDAYFGDGGVADMLTFQNDFSLYAYTYNIALDMLEIVGDALDYVHSSVETLIFDGVSYLFAELSGQSGGEDTTRPTVVSVTLDDTLLAIGETALVTFQFSEAVTLFDASDVDLSNADGVLGKLSSADGGVNWTATFTPANGVELTGQTIGVVALGYEDLANNAGAGGVSGAFEIDTLAPTATATVLDATASASATTVSGQLSGVLGASESVIVFRDGVAVGEAAIDGGGITWSFDDVALGGGEYSYAARVEDTAGNASAMSSPFILQLDGPITGTDGSDPQIEGTIGDDVISGVPNDSTTLGAGTVDVMFGNGGADLFIFGDARGVFYDDGNNRAGNTGKSDYGLIRNTSSIDGSPDPFVSGEDKIQLFGGADDYFLLADHTLSSVVGTAIVHDSNDNDAFDQRDEIIGLVEGASLSLTEDFVYVA